MSTAITSSTLTDGTCLVSANRDFGLGAAMPATSPPTIAPAISTAPIETHQRMAALPSFHADGDTQNAPRKAETRNCRSRSQQSRTCPVRPSRSALPPAANTGYRGHWITFQSALWVHAPAGLPPRRLAGSRQAECMTSRESHDLL